MAARDEEAALKRRITELKRNTNVTEHQLREKISPDDHLLAGCFDDYDTYLGLLRLTPSEKKDVRIAASLQDTQSATRKALTLWYKKNPHTSTYKALVKISIVLNQEQTATNICKYVKSKLKSCVPKDLAGKEMPITAFNGECNDNSYNETIPLDIHEPLMAEHSSYHGAIRGEEAERRLKEFGTNCYLTRYSRSQGYYMLSVYKPELFAEQIEHGIKNFKITITRVSHRRVFSSRSNQYQIGARKFNSPAEMLQYYEKNRIDPGFQDIGRCVTEREYLELLRTKNKESRNPNPEADAFLADRLQENSTEQISSDNDTKCSTLCTCM